MILEWVAGLAPPATSRFRPARISRNIDPLTARQDHVARRDPQMPVFAAATLHHIQGADRKTSRQARLTFHCQPHRTLHIWNSEATTGCRSARFPAFLGRGKIAVGNCG